MAVKRLYAVVLGLSLLVPLAVSAHPKGASWEAVVGAFTVAVGYEQVPTVGMPTVFDFYLYDAERKDTSFDSVWLRLGNEGGALFSGRLAGSESDKTILNYKFLESGNYTLLARYVRGGEVLAEHTFPFKVETELSSTHGSTNSLAPGLSTGVLSVVGALLFGAALILVKRGARGRVFSNTASESKTK